MNEAKYMEVLPPKSMEKVEYIVHASILGRRQSNRQISACIVMLALVKNGAVFDVLRKLGVLPMCPGGPHDM